MSFISRPSLCSAVFLLTVISASLNSCAPPQHYSKLPEPYYPLFIDDADTQSLLTALKHQLDYLRTTPADRTITVGGQDFTYAELMESLETFSDIVKTNPSPFELDEIVKQTFHIYQAEGRRNGRKRAILLTGYYEPLFEGSLVRQGPFNYPLYRVPGSLVIRKQKKTDESKIGRIAPDGSFLPYWSRKEIEQDDRLSGNELVYLRDPLDAYLLHVQGSGRIQLPDRTTRAIHFAGSNGLRYSSLGRLFVQENIMPVADVSIPTIRNYFVEHPEQMTRMLHNNPRYIFFKWGGDEGPKGSLGTVLTPGRSVAVDHSIFPAGVVGYLVSQRPRLHPDGSIDHWQQFSRFVLPQDSGSAIKGPGRIDLFWGAGSYAQTAASHMKENGQFYFLIKKQF
ncbi:MAG: MltA domain-containing protein [Desulfocapsaceae bacterium]|jgi:membrane-bound lytic murein transglycosylase A|nr:MltA domain-containing protein [Desulfocapsaceae bacterium]